MKCTLNNPAARYGIPIFVDDSEQTMGDLDGFLAMIKLTRITSAQVAELCNVSVRTVSGWRTGKTIPVSALNVCGQILTTWRYRNRPKK